MTDHLPPLDPVDPVERGRQLRSNYVYNTTWLPFDFGDLTSLLWRYDQADADGLPVLAGYYRAAWEALLRGLALDKTELGRWLLDAQPPVIPSLPAFVEREAPFAEDLMARAQAVANLLSLRDSVIRFGADEIDTDAASSPAAEIQDARLAQAIEDLYLRSLPDHLDTLGTVLLNIDALLYELLLAWHPRGSQTLPILISQYGFPDPGAHREKFEF